MATLADFPELVGFFSYSREDDDDSRGALSALRERIQRELRGQLGRNMKTFRLWQDKEAIAPGKLWEEEIKSAVGQSVFFIPIITPTVVRSHYCKFELDSFLAREAELGRSDLVFPILYIRVPELEDPGRLKNDPVLALIAKRQYLDWREFRHRDVQSTEVKEGVERFCGTIRDALSATWTSPQERKRQEEVAARQRAEAERKRWEEIAAQEQAQAERKRQDEIAAQQRAEAERKREEEFASLLQAEAERVRQDAPDQAEAAPKDTAENPESALPQWLASKPKSGKALVNTATPKSTSILSSPAVRLLATGLLACLLALIAIGVLLGWW